MRFIACSILLYFVTTLPSVAQMSAKLNVQANILPSIRVNGAHFNRTKSEGLKLLIADYERSSLEFVLHLFRGYDPSVTFSYGVALAYVPVHANNLLLKVGIGLSRFVVNDYKREREEIGDKTEDDMPDSFKPYIEWEWAFAKSFSLFVQGGYRVMSSYTTTVTGIRYRTNPVTGEQTPISYQTDENQHFYGSGFEFGVGLSVRVY